jgi:Protein of unknown function (DUF1697)
VNSTRAADRCRVGTNPHSPRWVFSIEMMLACPLTLPCYGVNNLGGKKVAMAKLREVVTSLGHTDVTTYIQSGNVLFTPRLADGRTACRAGTAALATELERAIADRLGVRACGVPARSGGIRPGSLGGRRTAVSPGEGQPGRSAAARPDGLLHTPDGYPPSELRRFLARVGGPTSVDVAGTARNWATVRKLVELCVP